MYRPEEIDAIVEKSILNLDFRKEPQSLYRPLEYMISIGGKRIRPKLCLTAFSLFSDNIGKQIIYPSLALEIFHSFTLIHDDIMDKADTRRNQLTIHKKWGDNCAILSGDVMSIIAYQYLSEYDGKELPHIFSLFSETAAQVCEGQQYDMDYEDIPIITKEEYLNMISLKTAVLIASSAKIGAIIGGADKETSEALYKFGHNIGMAFQITDDYLDTFGDEKVFGKKIGGDILNNKKTWLLVECFMRANDVYRRKLEKYMAINPTDSEDKISGIRQIYIELGIREGAKQAIKDYHIKALEAISGLGLTCAQYEQLKIFSEKIIYRER